MARSHALEIHVASGHVIRYVPSERLCGLKPSEHCLDIWGSAKTVLGRSWGPLKTNQHDIHHHHWDDPGVYPGQLTINLT